MQINKELAKSIAETWKRDAASWDALRDHVDSATAGDLDCFQLDMLTDWTMEYLLIGRATLPNRCPTGWDMVTA